MPKGISCNGKLSPEPRSGKAGLVDFSVTVKERLDILPVYLHLVDLPQWKEGSKSLVTQGASLIQQPGGIMDPHTSLFLFFPFKMRKSVFLPSNILITTPLPKKQSPLIRLLNFSFTVFKPSRNNTPRQK